jgi:hypothetical protein
MMNKNNHSISKRQGIWAAFLLAFAFMLAQPDKAQAQWVTNGNNINNTNTGNVGIGTTTPSTKLHVVGNGIFQGPGVNLGIKNTTGWTQVIAHKSIGQAAFIVVPAVPYSATNPYWAMGLGSDDSAGWSLETYDGLNMANRMRVLPNGNVGIGVTTPSHKLEIAGNSGNVFWAGASTGSTANIDLSGHVQLREYSTGGIAYLQARDDGSNRNIGLRFRTQKAGDAGPSITEAATIDANGRVGIGISNPSHTLDVVGDGNFLGAGAGLSVKNTIGWTQITAHRSAGQAAFIAAPSGAYSATNPYWAMGLSSDGSAGWSLETYDGLNMANRMRVLPNGNVGIGITNPAYRLDIQGGQINASGGLCMNGDCRTTWPTGSGTSQWATSGNNINNTNTGNVGIGTPAPSTKLHVVGDVTLTGTGNISATGTITAENIVAKYQDIAEWVPSRRAMPAGTVVVLDTDQYHHVLPSSQAYDTRVAGVISERPGLILGEGGEGKLLVATTGRVRVKVDATRAPIRAGDILVTSDREGIAMRSEPLYLGGTKIHRPGTIIGKALEPLDKGVGEILVLLSLQ